MARQIATLTALIFHVFTVGCAVTPVINTPNGRRFVSGESDGRYYRSILIDNTNQNAFIGARNYIYKIDLSGSQRVSRVNPRDSLLNHPDFGVAETQVGTEYDKQSSVYRTMDNYLNKHQPITLIATEKLSQVYKLQNQTYAKQCRRQIKILKLYYGNHLQLPIDDPELVCSQHNQGLTWLDSPGGKLFSLRNGVFGTMPVGLTGVTDFKKSWPVWLAKSAALTSPLIENWSYIFKKAEFDDIIFNANRTCYACGYSQEHDTKCSYPDVETSRNNYTHICYTEYGIPNYMSTHYLCDGTPNPGRVITDTNTMAVTLDSPLPGTERESCAGANLASTLMSGYHPNQVTKTMSSASGNGVRGGAAIYILAEIGQEKQLDVNHEAFMGFEEPIPLSSSASLSLVRVLVKADGEDVDHDNIVVSNPFKESWVTSPLTKFGRLVKSGNQATVPHRPRAVGIFEDENFVYFFFREVEWESMQHPEYTVNRHHFLWKSYDRTISYPWEKPYSDEKMLIKQFERTEPKMYMRYNRQTPVKFAELNKIRNEFVYAPRLDAFKQTWDNSKLVTRIGRVCKNDHGLPLGVQDASIFNLDYKLSLSAFQTFMKSKLTCTVKVNAVPRSWRFRKDMFSFIIERLTQRKLDICSTKRCVGRSCSNNYTVAGAPNEGIFCERNLKGRDVSFRAFLKYTTQFLDFINPRGLFQQTIGGFSQYHWAYVKEMSTFSSVSYEYTELKDLYKVGDAVYGVFSSPHSDHKNPHFALPAASAVCQFTMNDIKKAFNGPFKKRMNNAWRPFDPRTEGSPIFPSPYSCDADPITLEARNVKEMEIEFTDETLPLEKELKNFDLRGKSERLNFFEKDVEGSRTMWSSVEAEPIYTNLDTQYEKIQAEKVSNVTVLYLATVDGDIHKVATWNIETGDKNCWQPNATELERWWREETNLHNNSWGQDYFTLTQESLTRGGLDYIFKSEWDCDKTSRYNLLAVYKPFTDAKVKIWDMKLAGDQLVLGTDSDVRIVYTAQCSQYEHCSTCSRDPHCGWEQQTRKCLPYSSGMIQGITAPANCSACLMKTKIYDPNEDIFLDTTLSVQQSTSLDQFKWYHNGSLVTERLGRFVLTRNNSLYVMNGRPDDAGSWELRDTADNTCMVTHNLTLSECLTEECQYEKQILNWCSEHDSWLSSMHLWQVEMEKSGCVNPGDD